MVEASDDEGGQWERLPDECPVYRAALNWEAVDKRTGVFVRGAFLRRPPRENGEKRDVKGISVEVYRDEGYTENQIIELILANKNKCRGIGRLIVGPVRDIPTTPQLDVVQDKKNHANIEGLPEHGKEVAKAERLATLLARLTETIWMPL